MTQNSINNNATDFTTTNVTVDPGTSGDSFCQFSINTTGEFRIGVDDDASDAFKISQGSALGSNDTFIMTAAGERTMPLQPAFLAYLGSSVSNTTGAGATWQLGTTTALTEVYDQNGDFNTNGTFTAPVTGRYFLTTTIRTGWSSLTPAMNNGYLSITTSNRQYSYYMEPYVNAANGSGGSFTLNVIADMDAADTAIATLTVNNGAGNTLQITGGSTLLTFFTGALIC